MYVNMKGRGGQKCQNNCPHGLWMPPHTYLVRWSTKGRGGGQNAQKTVHIASERPHSSNWEKSL